MMRRHSSFPRLRWCLTTAVITVACASRVFASSAHNEVVTLDINNFDTEVNDPANPLWLLKFYAPWCGHCKHLAPVLDRVATKVAGKMAIGKIDCTVQKKLCDQHKISGYPTLKFSMDGEIMDYPGSRAEPELIQFANKMSAPAVILVSSYEDAMARVSPTEEEERGEGESLHGVIFMAYDPQVQTTSVYQNLPLPEIEEFLRKSDITAAFEKVARKEKANAQFALLQPGADCCTAFISGGDESSHDAAFVARLEANVPPRIWQPPKSVLDYATSLQVFVTENYFPLVNQVGPDNFHKLGRHGKPLVLGVVQGSNKSQVETMKRQLLEFGLQGPADIVSRYYLGWIDGHLWQKFLEQFEIKADELPQVFVLDVPKKRYWQNATISQQEGIPAFMKAIRDGTIRSKVSSGTGKDKGVWGVLHMLGDVFLENLPWSLLILLSACAAFAILVVPPADDLRPPYRKRQPRRPQQHEGEEEVELTDTKDAPVETKKEQ